MRRVVTGEIEGRSVVVSDGVVPSSKYWDELWLTSADEPLGHQADGQMLALEPEAGGTNWRLVAVLPRPRWVQPGWSTRRSEEWRTPKDSTRPTPWTTSMSSTATSP